MSLSSILGDISSWRSLEQSIFPTLFNIGRYMNLMHFPTRALHHLSLSASELSNELYTRMSRLEVFILILLLEFKEI